MQQICPLFAFQFSGKLDHIIEMQFKASGTLRGRARHCVKRANPHFNGNMHVEEI